MPEPLKADRKQEPFEARHAFCLGRPVRLAVPGTLEPDR